MAKDPLSGKKIILGITGCIAAYKACLVLRELKKRGAEVKVIMTPSACEFITPLTLSSLSQNDVIVNSFPRTKNSNTSLNTWHIDLALWADLMLIAPATVNTVAKISAGFADNALTTIVTALRCPLAIVPAADMDMYNNPVTQQNLLRLEELGYNILPAESGDLASGLEGEGRFPEISKIIEFTESVLIGYKKDLSGNKILVTAGPTYEDIDPVRFLGNRSSGKMGYAIAKAASLRGADVTLISGPSSENIYQEIKTVKVRSAKEMKNAVSKELKTNDVLIMSAAVADFKPKKISSAKIKKDKKFDQIDLVNTDDILSSIKKDDKIVVGFALETDKEVENAKKKLKDKNLDLIVLNSLKDKKSGFEHNTNKISIITSKGKTKKLPLLSKFQAANKILDELVGLRQV